MPEKPTRDNDPAGHSADVSADPATQPVYGNRWGPGPIPTPHIQPGSTAGNPASASRPLSGRDDPAPTEAEAGGKLRPEDDEAALREAREQRWDSEGGAAAAPRRRG
jgi:hypothetical protein